MTSRSERTRRRLADCALRLFADQGYDATTVTQIAAAARVSHMTFFRHFPTKEDVVVGDPYDPVIADAVAAQPATLDPFDRARAGVRAAWTRIAAELDEAGSDDGLRLRLRIIASHPGLRARMWESQHETQQAIAAALRDGGATHVAAQAAAGACLGALVWALLAWVDEGPERSFGSVVLEALRTLDAAHADDAHTDDAQAGG